MQIPRPEHPKPQFMRKSFINLNGSWQFEIDQAVSGQARGLFKEGVALSGQITLPFCPESRLSGVGHTDFMAAVWYKRNVTIDELPPCALLHFGAVDYRCTVYVNGQEMGSHTGGYVSFAIDITSALRVGENEIAVFAEDDTRNPMQPSGKQSNKYASYACLYTRTTGIWQTVWLEFLPAAHMQKVKYYPNIADGSVTVSADLTGCGDFACQITFGGKPMGAYNLQNATGTITFNVPLAEKHLWQVGQGNLYDVEFTFGDDRVQSYFGLRQVQLEGYKFLINGKSVFQRLILDQGFYPDGIYTAPTDADLKRDIELSLAAGFNGARLHEKVFEERFLYYADQMGYLVWGEYPDWGLNHSSPENIYAILPEWTEVVQRDFNHPAIIGWCPRNESWITKRGVHNEHLSRRSYAPGVALLYDTTKALDPTRPCIDASGGFHAKTDIYDVHDYNQDPVSFKENYDRLMTEGVLHDRFDQYQTYRGEATFVSEYGGIAWNTDEGGWGYGKGPQTLEEFYSRFKGLTDALLDNCKMFGLCYTQLTNVEQEQNGLYTYDRQPKFDMQRLAAIMQRKAAIED